MSKLLLTAGLALTLLSGCRTVPPATNSEKLAQTEAPRQEIPVDLDNDVEELLGRLVARRAQIAQSGYEAAAMSSDARGESLRTSTRRKFDIGDEFHWARRWLESVCDVGTTEADRIAAFQRYRERIGELLKYAEARKEFDVRCPCGKPA